MLVTLKPPTSGKATINGFDIVKQPDKVRKSIGIVFQDPSSDEILTGYENLKLHGWLYDMPDELREDRINGCHFFEFFCQVLYFYDIHEVHHHLVVWLFFV